MKNKKILFLCQYFYPDQVSTGILPTELAIFLHKKGYEVSALVGYPKEYNTSENVNKKEKYKGIQIKRVNYFQSNRNSIIKRIINYLGFAFSILLHPISFFKNELFICYTNPPLLPFICAFYSFLFHKKMIMVVYDLYPDVAIKLGVLKKSSFIARVFENANQFAFSKSSKIIVLSNEMMEYLKINKGINHHKIEVIPNWYIPRNDKTARCKDSSILNVFYGGNMGKAQDMDTLLSAIKELKNNSNIQFHFVGHGVKKNDITSLVNKENLSNCHIYEFLPK